MNRLLKLLTCGIVLPAVFAGCGVGYTRQLLVTKTNFGVEWDTKPPTLQIDMDRMEGSIGPQFEKGKKMPTLTSFRFSNGSIFRPWAGSTFATGDAAVALAALYDDPKPAGDWESRMNSVKEGANGEPPIIDSSLPLDAEPTIGFWGGICQKCVLDPNPQPESKKPVLMRSDLDLTPG